MEGVEIDREKRMKAWVFGFIAGALAGFGFCIMNMRNYIAMAFKEPTLERILLEEGLIIVLIGLLIDVYSYFKYVKS
jgi:hypothetical protein